MITMEPIQRRIRRQPDHGSRTEEEAVRENLLEALKAHPGFRPVAVEVERAKRSTLQKGDTREHWTAMDREFNVLSGTLGIDWADSGHTAGEMTVHVGSAGLW